jgi:hypothetical protein
MSFETHCVTVAIARKGFQLSCPIHNACSYWCPFPFAVALTDNVLGVAMADTLLG